MPKKPNKRSPDSLDDDERIARAKIIISNLVTHTVNLVMVHEANAIVLYSDQLSSQIPRSNAANAFNQFRNSMHLFELIRLCAIWDGYGSDRESIPTVIELMNKDGLFESLLTKLYDSSLNEQPPANLDLDNESVKSWWNKDRCEISDAMKETTRKKFEKITPMISEIRSSDQLKRLQAFRDKFIAHNLNYQTDNNEEVKQTDVSMHRYEDKLLSDTIEIVELLNSVLNRTCFAWDQSVEIAKRRARDLWNNCIFNIVSRELPQFPLKEG